VAAKPAVVVNGRLGQPPLFVVPKRIADALVGLLVRRTTPGVMTAKAKPT
jgi:hypothetical protein